MDSDDNFEREGYRLFVDPVIGLLQICMTSATAITLLEVLKTEHGRMFVQNIPALIKATIHTYI